MGQVVGWARIQVYLHISKACQWWGLGQREPLHPCPWEPKLTHNSIYMRNNGTACTLCEKKYLSGSLPGEKGSGQVWVSSFWSGYEARMVSSLDKHTVGKTVRRFFLPAPSQEGQLGAGQLHVPMGPYLGILWVSTWALPGLWTNRVIFRNRKNHQHKTGRNLSSPWQEWGGLVSGNGQQGSGQLQESELWSGLGRSEAAPHKQQGFWSDWL